MTRTASVIWKRWPGSGAPRSAFSETRLKAAAAAAYDKFGFYHSFNHKTPDNTIDLAEKLVEISPIPDAQAYFATLRLGSHRDDGEARLGISRGPWQARQAQDHRPRSRFPWLDDRCRLDVRSSPHAP